MSGEKYLKVTDRQIIQMMATCRAVNQDRVVEQNLRRELGQAEAAIQRRAQEAQARYAGYDSHLSGMSTDMQTMARAHRQSLQAQRAQFDASLADLGQHLNAPQGGYLELIKQQDRQLRADMETQRRALQGQIQQLATTIERKETHEADRARQWLSDAHALLGEIEHTCRHQVFKPGALQALQLQLQLAETNHGQGLYQATVATAQQTVLRALELRLELEQMDAEWSAHQAAALTASRETLAWCDSLSTTRFMLDTTAGTEELDAEIDYWTGNALTQLQHQVRQQVEAMTHAEPGSTPLAVLKQAIDDAALWREDAHTLVEQARVALVLSQARRDIADQVVEALAVRGWSAVDSAYEGEATDGRGWRNAYHLKLANVAGDEMVTIIAPDAQGTQGANCVTFSYTGQHNDVDFNKNLTKAVSGALNQIGLEVGEPRAVPGYENRSQGDPARRDFEQVRHAQLARSTG